jgi:hypothetical protein
MKPRPAFLVFATLAVFLQASGNTRPMEVPRVNPDLLIGSVTSQTGNAVLSVASGLPTQAGTVNPLAGKGVALFKESFGGFLKRRGMFQGPPGSTIKQSPLAVWAYACQTGSPACQQALYEMRPNSVAETRMDQNARATLPSVPAGTYYLYTIAVHNKQFLVWDLRVDLKPGSNSIVLTQANSARLDASDERTASGSSQSDINSQPCKVSEITRPARSAAANSTLSVRGGGYVYTYTETNRRTGEVTHSATERGNFSNTTLYLLDEDAETVLQQAGIQPVVFPVRLSLIESVSFYDAFGEVKNVPGMETITGLLGGKKEDLEMSEAKAEFDCAMKAIRSHSVAQMTTDANASGTFPRVPAGTYYLYGRFYRVQKPFRGGGMVWNLKVVVKPGVNALTLTVSNAAYK